MRETVIDILPSPLRTPALRQSELSHPHLTSSSSLLLFFSSSLLVPWPREQWLHSQTSSTASSTASQTSASSKPNPPNPRNEDVRNHAAQDLQEQVALFSPEVSDGDNAKGIWGDIFHRTFELTRSNNQSEKLGVTKAMGMSTVNLVTTKTHPRGYARGHKGRGYRTYGSARYAVIRV